MRESIDVLIACFNEEESIESVILDHLKVLEETKVFENYLITVLDDGSTDGSHNKISKIKESNNHIRLIVSDKPSGISEAFNKLLASTNNDWVYFTSGDGQFPASILSEIVSKFDNRTDLYITKRINKIEIYSIFRLLISYLYRVVVLIISGKDPIDAGSNKLARRSLLEEKYECKYLARDAELVIKTKMKHKNLSIIECKFGSRENGKSTIRIRVIIKTFLDSFHLIKYRFPNYAIFKN